MNFLILATMRRWIISYRAFVYNSFTFLDVRGHVFDDGRFASNHLMSEVLFNHDGLIGTLLGFGRDNAFLVHEHGISKSDAEVDDLKQKFNFGNPWETEEMELDEKLESIGWINAFITGNHLKNLDLNPLPGFIAILDHPETLRLKESYLQTRKKMLAYYKGKDFLEATLLALTSEEEFF